MNNITIKRYQTESGYIFKFKKPENKYNPPNITRVPILSKLSTYKRVIWGTKDYLFNVISLTNHLLLAVIRELIHKKCHTSAEI